MTWKGNLQWCCSAADIDTERRRPVSLVEKTGSVRKVVAYGLFMFFLHVIVSWTD